MIFLQIKQRGFTLAEVLITLGIIGIVAALTIPALTKSYEKQSYLTGFKKAYTQMNDAVLQVAQDYGCTGDLVCTGLFSAPNTTNQAFGDAITSKFNIVKNCGFTTETGCWPSSYNANFDGSGSDYSHDTSTYYRFVTKDGFMYMLGNFVADCETPTYSNGVTGHMKKVCCGMRFDVNGAKKPNRYGMDIFSFWVTNGKGLVLYPQGGVDDRYGNTSNYSWSAYNPPLCSDNSGRRMGYPCAGRIMEEGWQIKYY